MLWYGGQLALNLAWQPLFFLLKRPGVAQADNVGELFVEWLAVIVCVEERKVCVCDMKCRKEEEK